MTVGPLIVIILGSILFVFVGLPHLIAKIFDRDVFDVFTCFVFGVAAIAVLVVLGIITLVIILNWNMPL